MILKKTTSFLTTIILLLFLSNIAFSQERKENILTTAIQLFDEGDFEKAEPLLQEVYDNKPEDFMVNYFYGACRTENNHFTNADLECLIIANQEVSPVNINYYFGVQYHARSNWERALKFYSKFSNEASLTEQKTIDIKEKIQQCYEKVNPYEQYMTSESIITAPDESLVNDSIVPQINSDSSNVELISEIESSQDLIITAPVLSNPTSKTEVPDGETILFYINSDITYKHSSHFQTENGKSYYEEGSTKQKELDAILDRTNILRENYSSTNSADEKNLIAQEILSLESKSYDLKKETRQLLMKAKFLENEYWQAAASTELDNFILKLNQFSQNQTNLDQDYNKKEPDSTAFIDPGILFGNKEIVMPTEETGIDELVYKIQIGTYSRGIPNYMKKLYNKLSLIRKIENYTDEKGVVVYTTGNLSNYEDALIMQNQVKQEGIEHAKVVPYFNGKRITLERAKEIEVEK